MLGLEYAHFPSYKTAIYNLNSNTSILIPRHNSIIYREITSYAWWLIIISFIIFLMIRDDLVVI